MILNKITTGFVTQRFDSETGEWLDQEFIAGDESFETEDGEPIDEDGEWLDANQLPAENLPLLMVQPNRLLDNKSSGKTTIRCDYNCIEKRTLAGCRWMSLGPDRR